MKIKTQFVFLTALIVAIPFLCLAFIPCYFYFRSSDRYLVDGYKVIRESQSSELSEQDKKVLFETLTYLPSDIQSLILSNGQITGTNIPELKEKSYLTSEDLWSFIQSTSTNYFYQFTTVPSTDSNTIIITRINRNRNNIKQQGREKLLSYVFMVMIILVLICVLFVIYISSTIFKSLKLIETKAQEIASGDLTVKFNLSESNSKVQNEITTITDSLEKMRLSLIDEQTRRNRFIMGISHDLRTPIAVIKGYTEAISDGMISQEEMPNTLELISTKTGQLGSMINTLINFMKLDTSQWYQNLKNEDISELIRNFAKESEITGTLFKREVTSLIDLPNEILIPMDSQLVTRVFENIFSNAIRYSKEEDSIHISAYEDCGNVMLEISDTGCGMTKEDINHIFDLFYRGTSSRREEGMGIGLSVVKTIIDTMNWKIDVESNVGEGSTFIITIPKPVKKEEEI